MSLCWEFSYIYSLPLVQSSRKEFEKFPIGGKGGRFELLKQMNTCFVCLEITRNRRAPTRSYVDDLIDSLPSKSEAIEGSRGTQNMLAKGGFTVKC